MLLELPPAEADKEDIYFQENKAIEAGLSALQVKLSFIEDMWKKLTITRKKEIKLLYPKSFAEYDMETLDLIEKEINKA